MSKQAGGARTAAVKRDTQETRISVRIDLDGTSTPLMDFTTEEGQVRAFDESGHSRVKVNNQSTLYCKDQYEVVRYVGLDSLKEAYVRDIGMTYLSHVASLEHRFRLRKFLPKIPAKYFQAYPSILSISSLPNPFHSGQVHMPCPNPQYRAHSECRIGGHVHAHPLLFGSPP